MVGTPFSNGMAFIQDVITIERIHFSSGIKQLGFYQMVCHMQRFSPSLGSCCSLLSKEGGNLQ